MTPNNESSGAPYLELIDGSESRRIPLAPNTACQIGRDEQSTIVVHDNQVSRRHAMVQLAADGHVYLTDLGSRNGTWVNDRRVACPVALNNGDTILVGSVRLCFHGAVLEEKEHETGAGETVVEIKNRLITVLVIDIRDFTPLSRKLQEHRLSELISTFMRECGLVLVRHNAWGQKYIGDAVMAIWLHQSDAPTLCELLPVFRSLEGITSVAANLHLTLGLDSEIRVGAGVNTGKACVGNMGSEASADYTALSDAVNLAFRLETASKEIEGDVALGARTYEFLAERAQAGDLFEHYELSLKGYREPKPVHGIRHSQVPELLARIEQSIPKSSSSATAAALGNEVLP